MYRAKMDGRMSAILCWGYLRRQLKSPAIEMSLRLQVLKLPSVMVQQLHLPYRVDTHILILISILPLFH